MKIHDEGDCKESSQYLSVKTQLVAVLNAASKGELNWVADSCCQIIDVVSPPIRFVCLLVGGLEPHNKMIV